MADLVETMVSANNEIPWHRKGEVLSGYPDIDVMYEKSGLDWSTDIVQTYYMYNGVQTKSNGFSIVRDSDGKELGRCTERYVAFQNKEAFQWCRPLIDSGLWVMETAGALCEGKVCWALLNQGAKEVMKGDNLKNYLLMQWGHTGHDSIRCGLTSIRVVCNNTLQQALRNDGATMAKLQHNSQLNLKLSALHELYDKTQQDFEGQQEIFQKFLEKPLDKNEKEEYIEELLQVYVPQPVASTTMEGDALKKAMDAWKKRLDNTRAQINLYVEDGSGQRDLGISGNLWGVFNGVEEWIEKCQGGKRIKDRGYNILQGQGRDYVNLAYNKALAMV